MRRFVLAATFVLCTVSFAFSETFFASITKVEGNKVTYKKFEKGGKGAGEEVTTEAAKDVTVTKGAFGGFKKGKDADKDKKAEPIEGGLKNEMFTKIGEKGQFAQITIADEGDNKGKITNIAPVTFGGGFKKGKDAKKDDKKDGK